MTKNTIQSRLRMLAPDVDTHSDNAKRDDAGDGDDDADDDNEVTAISRLGPPLKNSPKSGALLGFLLG